MTRRFLTVLLAGVALVLGSVALQPLPRANAAPEAPETVEHNSHGTHWAWVCLSVRPPEGPDIEHSHVYVMDEFHVRVFCQGDTPSGLQECTWHAIEWAGGQVTGPYGATPYCELNTDGAADLQMFRAAPARPSHNYDGSSLYTCSQEEPPNGTPTATWVVRHSHPVALTEAYVDYRCCAWDGARDVRYWATLWWNGATNAHGGYDYGVLGSDCF